MNTKTKFITFLLFSLVIWILPISIYLLEPKTIMYILICFFYFIIFLLVFSYFSTEKGYKVDKYDNILIYTLILLVLGITYGFTIEVNNIENNKEFINYAFLDFIFPFSIICFSSLPLTYLIIKILINYKK